MIWKFIAVVSPVVFMTGCGGGSPDLSASAAAVIEISPSITYQTMTGWEGTAQIGQTCARDVFLPYRDPLLDRLVNELGINRVRLELTSGTENPIDWFTLFYTGQVSPASARSRRYEIINDNADPRATNPAGFQFAMLDHDAEHVVNPLRQLLAARAERLYVTLTYVDFGNTPFEHSQNPDEYAEFILATFQHLQQKYGWVPDAVELILEPDNTANWRPSTIGPAIVATGDRLKAAGFKPAFIAPSNTNASGAVTSFDELARIPRVLEYLTDLAYHRYSGVSRGVLEAIGARSVQYGIRTGMLEHIASGYEDLHEDLEHGRVSAWQQYALSYCSGSDDGTKYYQIDADNAAQPQIILGSRSRFLRQYFLFVRMGAVRIGAASTDGRFDPLAFRNPNGRFTVVVKASGSGEFQVRNLPAGTYGRKFTTASQFDIDLTDVGIAAGQALLASIPESGVMTLYQR